jgi:hypothetical protein
MSQRIQTFAFARLCIVLIEKVLCFCKNVYQDMLLKSTYHERCLCVETLECLRKVLSVRGPCHCRCDTIFDGVVIAEVPGFLILCKQQQFEQDSGKWGIMSAHCPNTWIQTALTPPMVRWPLRISQSFPSLR